MLQERLASTRCACETQSTLAQLGLNMFSPVNGVGWFSLCTGISDELSQRRLSSCSSLLWTRKSRLVAEDINLDGCVDQGNLDLEKGGDGLVAARHLGGVPSMSSAGKAPVF